MQEVKFLVVSFGGGDARVLPESAMKCLTEEEREALEVLMQSGKWKTFGSVLIEPRTHHMYAENWPM